MSGPARILEAGVFEDHADNIKPSPFAASAAAPTVSPVVVRVVAPSNLQGGYTFDAVYNGQVFTVTVPPGGVNAGQALSAPFVPSTSDTNNFVFEAVAVPVVESIPIPIPMQPPTTTPSERTPMLSPPAVPPGSSTGTGTSPNQNGDCNRNCNHTSNHKDNHNRPSNAPLGSWSTDVCDCCSEGCCHPSLCNAMFCPQVLMGQVLTRMKLDWCGNVVSSGDYKRTTCIWFLLTVVYLVVRSSLSGCATDASTTSVWGGVLENILDDDDDDDDDMFDHVDTAIHDAAQKVGGEFRCTPVTRNLLWAVGRVWFVLTIVVLARLRRAVRRTYRIPQSCCCCEDFVCSAFCGCCTVSQLARQTADYQRERAYFITDTGLAAGAMDHCNGGGRHDV